MQVLEINHAYYLSCAVAFRVSEEELPSKGPSSSISSHSLLFIIWLPIDFDLILANDSMYDS